MVNSLEQLKKLMWNLPGRGLIDELQYQLALDHALIPDSEGRWPGQPGYVPTHDVAFAAYQLVGFLAAQPQVTNGQSEGTSVTTTPPDWQALLRYLAGLSIILGHQDVLRMIPLPPDRYLRRTDMSGRGDYNYGDVDTDIG